MLRCALCAAVRSSVSHAGVMEVFTFLKATGGGAEALERMTVLPIGIWDVPDGHRRLVRQRSAIGSAAGIVTSMARLRAFDAARAQCFKPEDRDRLLSIIESGYGDFGEFNRVVRRAFELRLDTRHSMQNLFGENGQQSRWRVGSRRATGRASSESGTALATV